MHMSHLQKEQSCWRGKMLGKQKSSMIVPNLKGVNSKVLPNHGTDVNHPKWKTGCLPRYGFPSFSNPSPKLPDGQKPINLTQGSQWANKDNEWAEKNKKQSS